MIFSYELETQLLAGLLKYPGEYCKIAAVISDKDFYSESNKINKTIFLILKHALENAETVNEVIISQRVKDLGISFEENINPSDYIESLAVKKIGADSVLATAKELKKFTIRRQIYERCVSVGKKMRGLSSAVPYQEIIDIVDKDFNDQINLYESNENEPENIFDTMEEVIEERGNNPITQFGLKGPYPVLQKIYGSLVRPGNISIVVARAGFGKELAHYAKIKTPTGWITHGEAKVGDEITCPDGSTSKINGVFPQGKKDIYRIHFKDGRFVDSGLEHLWKVWSIGPTRKFDWLILTTEQIIKKLTKKSNKAYLPLTNEIEFKSKEKLPIDPYILGVLLGDGTITGCGNNKLPSITTQDEEIYQITSSIYKTGNKIFDRRDGKQCWSFVIRDGNVRENLKKLNLFGTYSYNKFIPKEYKLASVNDRYKIIKGLMDTDASICRYGSPYYTTVSKQLAEDFQEVCWSLGFICKINTVKTTYKYKGEIKNGRIAYRVSIRCIDPRRLFKIQRRLDKMPPFYQHAKNLRLKIVKIEKLPQQEEAVCIKIDHPEQLYITDNYVVTHNTSLALDFTTKISYEHSVPVLHFDNGEMSKRELMDRQCAAMAQVPLSLIESGNWRKAGQEIERKVRSVWEKINKMKFYYYNVGGSNVDSQINILKRFYYSKIGRGNPLIFSFDYIKSSSERTNSSIQEHQIIGELVDKYKRCIQKELVFDNEPVVSMYSSVQANRTGVVGKKHSDDVVEDETVVSLSDRIIHFASHMFILRAKTLDEKANYPDFGTHTLTCIKSRHLGEDIAGALNPVKMPDGSFKKNYINLDFNNFGITEKGDLRDIVKSMEDHILAENEPDDIPKGL